MEDTNSETLTPEEQVAVQQPPTIVVRLTTGDDLVCTLIGSSADTIEIINPLLVVLQDGEKGLGMRLAPYFMPYARGPITLNTGCVVAYLRAVDEKITDAYKQFFSPIIQPPSGILV